MPHAGYTGSVTNDRPGPMRTCPVRAPRTHHSSHRGNFTNPHFTFPVHEHSFIHSYTSKHRICNYCIMTLRVVTRSDSHLIQHERQMTKVRRPTREGLVAASRQHERQSTRVRRPAHEGLEATTCRIELGEKTYMSPSGLCPTRSEVDRVISTFLFDPNLEPCP